MPIMTWTRMCHYFNISNDHWPFDGIKDWKARLHIWIDENIDDISEQKLNHKMVNDW